MNLVSAERTSPNSQGTLVMLHGLGSDEQDLFGFADLIDKRIDVICIRAPKPYGPGFAWFDIQWTSQGIQVDPNEVQESVEAVTEEISKLNKPNLIVGGFSQGAMMSLGIVNRIPENCLGAVVLSGRSMPPGPRTFTGPIFQAHGIFDDVIPIEEARELSQSLTNHEYHEYEMGHSICEPEMDDLNRWLAKTLDLK